MNVVWAIAGLGVLGAVAAIAWLQGRGRQSDLGFVSHQWVAEHRLSQTQDPRR